MERNKILIISTSFGPSNTIGAIRMSKIAKFLSKEGFFVDVLTFELNNNKGIDITIDLSENPNINIIRVPFGPIFRNTLYKFKKQKSSKESKKNVLVQKSKKETKFFIFKKRLVNIFFLIYTSFENISWENSVKRYIASKKDTFDQEYSIILSSHPRKVVHKLAKYLKKEYDIKWIADFRDPLAYEALNSKFGYLYNKYLQRKYCNNADIVTYVSKEMLYKLSGGVKDLEKFHYVPNGFDENDLSYIKSVDNDDISNNNNDTLIISYVGGLYGGKRDLSIIFSTVQVLLESGRIDRRSIKFIYAGKEYDVIMKQAIKYKVEDILEDKGVVERQEALGIQQRSNIVIVSTWNTIKDIGVIPAKVYECFLLKKPTIVITNGTLANSELGEMVTKAGLGIEINTMENQQNAIDKLSDFLCHAHESIVKKDNIELGIDYDYIERFNYKNIVNMLVKLINDPNLLKEKIEND